MRAHWLIAALCSWFAWLDAVGQDLFTIEEGAGPPLVRFDAAAMADAGVDAGVSGSFVLRGFPVSRAERVDIELHRFRIVTEETVITTSSGRIPVDPEAVKLFRGRVRGYAGSHVFLALGESYSIGRIELGPGRASYTISAQSGGMEAAEELAVRPTQIGGSPLGRTTAPYCEAGTKTDNLLHDEGLISPEDERAVSRRPGSLGPPTLGMRRVRFFAFIDPDMAVVIGNERATIEYFVILYAAISDITMRDVRVRLDLVEMRFIGNPPSGIPFDMNQIVWADLQNRSFGGFASICGSGSTVNGLLGFFGDTPNPLIHSDDLTVAAHEIGHVLGGPHTHDLMIDRCQTAAPPARRGTLMSYCGQTYSGGRANQDKRFHTAVQERIRDCLSGRGARWVLDCNQNGADDAEDIAQGVSMDLNGNAVPDECEDCNGNMVLDSDDIASGASLDLNGNGVPDECEPDCNGNGRPDDLDFLIGSGPTAFEDNFETDKGWIVENLGATSGDWERAVPVNDPSWPYAPAMDSDGSGHCLVTDNAPGESDVDDGATRITSPVIDMSRGDFTVAFDYFLFSSAADRLVVEATNDGANWTELFRIAASAGSAWRTTSIAPQTFVARGVPQSPTMQLRFTLGDEAPDNIVEGAIDAFRVISPLSHDENGNGIPDECEADCNGNQISDYLEINADMSLDLDRNVVLDECQNCDGDEFTDLEEINGAGNVWAVVPDENIIREYHAVTGVMVRESDPAVLMDPSDVLITEDGRVLVTSTGDSRVVEFDRRGRFVRDLVSPGAGGLQRPGSMIVSTGGTLLVASEGTDEVLEYDLISGAPRGAFVSSGSGGLSAPYGMTYRRGGNLFVTSDGSQGASVLEFDGGTGSFVRVFVEEGSGPLARPRDILFTPSGREFLATSITDEILEYDAQTGAYVGRFNIGHFGNKLADPWGMAIGPDQRLYVTSNRGGTDGHLTDPRILLYDALSGIMITTYVHGRDSLLNFPRGFDFLPTAGDCNLNMLPDECDISSGYSMDLNGNGVPDECETCYADCDQSTGAEVLDVFDFLCFQDAFLSNDPWACGCDTMSGAGVCDVFDYLCFVDSFMNGCP